MKRIIIMSLVVMSMCTMISCSNITNKGNENEIVDDTILVGEGESAYKENDKGSGQVIDAITDQSEKRNEDIYIEKYGVIKEILENAKMTINEADDKEIEAENGIDETVVYKLNDENQIVIRYNVNLTSILNDGSYDINGTVFNNVLSEIIDENEYLDEINKAITEYISNEKEYYSVEFAGIKVDIGQEYEFIRITVTI